MPTPPASGVAFVTYYFDRDVEALPTIEGSNSAEIHELDAEGASIFRTYGTFD